MAKMSKPFDASMFTATKSHTAEDKAAFGNRLIAFIEADFPSAKFTEAFYTVLINTFGFIAHYDRKGFWSTFFTNTVDKISFVKQLLDYPALCSPDPKYTFSDVEQAVRAALLARNTLARYETQNLGEIEQAERGLLARLKARYEPGNALAATGDDFPPRRNLSLLLDWLQLGLPARLL